MNGNRHRFLLCAAAFAIVASGGCLHKKNDLAALWFFTHSSGPLEDKEKVLTPANFILLMPDGSYTRDFGRFEYGQWAFKDRHLYLVDASHRTLTLPVTLSGENEMQIDRGDKVEANFESAPLPSAEPRKNPFSRENNTWRIPAGQKEDDRQIRERLLNHCRFWEMYFSWALDDKIATIDVRSTPTPIKIYGNGFGLKSFDDLPPAWRSCFYDEEDCRKGLAILEEIFRTKNIAWAHTDNKYKMFLSAFQQIERYLGNPPQ